ncbi:hypothetical protein L873DRAFT_1807151 [Choiromyces venosus 120613-1]|uniref:Uncharacterized protein n=1 Tax=Choiromyces venosus 120613-1 TaxID=1336337 RepID=A0A3N4JSX2_9PEZI|nr:hypothetical protein L873DRAFT_1807151 [Choiromyces venosus 120613-1]
MCTPGKYLVSHLIHAGLSSIEFVSHSIHPSIWQQTPRYTTQLKSAIHNPIYLSLLKYASKSASFILPQGPLYMPQNLHAKKNSNQLIKNSRNCRHCHRYTYSSDHRPPSRESRSLSGASRVPAEPPPSCPRYRILETEGGDAAMYHTRLRSFGTAGGTELVPGW